MQLTPKDYDSVTEVVEQLKAAGECKTVQEYIRHCIHQDLTQRGAASK